MSVGWLVGRSVCGNFCVWKFLSSGTGASIVPNVCRSVGRSVENFLNSNNQSSLIIFDSLINSGVLRTSLGRGSERITENRFITICVNND